MRAIITVWAVLILAVVSSRCFADTAEFESEFDLVENEMDREFVEEMKERVRDRCAQIQNDCMEASDPKYCDKLVKKTPGCKVLFELKIRDRRPTPSVAATPTSSVAGMSQTKPSETAVSQTPTQVQQNPAVEEVKAQPIAARAPQVAPGDDADEEEEGTPTRAPATEVAPIAPAVSPVVEAPAAAH